MLIPLEMILYNVTVNISEKAHNEWLQWMKEEHIPEVMATGLFTGYKMFRIITRLEDETGITYAIQYFLDNLEKYYRYRDEFAPALQQKTLMKYREQLIAFRTLMEEA